MIIVRSSNWKEPKIHVRPRTHSWATAVMVNVLQMATETGKTAVQAEALSEDKLKTPFLYESRGNVPLKNLLLVLLTLFSAVCPSQGLNL